MRDPIPNGIIATNPCTQSRTATNASPVTRNEDEAAEPAACWLTVSSASRLRVPIRMKTFSTTLPTTDPRARVGLNSLRTGYSAMAMPIPVAAQTNSKSAVMTTALSLPANLAKSTGAPTVAPSGTMLSMDAAEQRMNRTPTAIAFPLYDFIVSRLHCLNTGTRRQGDAQHDKLTLDRPSWAVIGTKVPAGPTACRVRCSPCLVDGATSGASRSRGGGSTGCRPLADYRISAKSRPSRQIRAFAKSTIRQISGLI